MLLLLVVFMICHLAGIAFPHSGGDAHFGENIQLQQQVAADNE